MSEKMAHVSSATNLCIGSQGSRNAWVAMIKGPQPLRSSTLKPKLATAMPTILIKSLLLFANPAVLLELGTN